MHNSFASTAGWVRMFPTSSTNRWGSLASARARFSEGSLQSGRRSSRAALGPGGFGAEAVVAQRSFLHLDGGEAWP